MKNHLIIVGLVGLLLSGCGGNESNDVECGDAVAINAASGQVCVIEGDLLIETGFSCPAELHYQHEYGGYAVCSSSAELSDDVRRTIDGMQPTVGIEGGACLNVICRLGERCVDGRCIADIDPGCLGGVCDRDGTDSDGDGVGELQDNCPGLYNPDQIDSDGDGIGNACDELTDMDGDGVYDRYDNCPRRANPAQTDADQDGVGDVCDDCDSGDVDRDGLTACDERIYGTDETLADTDGDGLDDFDEIRIGLDPLVVDTDRDGLIDGAEAGFGLDPLIPSTFKDGIEDGQRRFLDRCKDGDALVEIVPVGTGGIRAVLPKGMTTTSLPVDGYTTENGRTASTFEDISLGLSGFVATRAAQQGETPAEILAETIGTSSGIFPFELPNGGDAALIRGIEKPASTLESASIDTLLQFAPFALPHSSPTSSTARPVGTFLVFESGDELVVIGAFYDANSEEAATSSDSVEQIVSPATFQPDGAVQPECVALGRASEARPIDTIIVVDPGMSDAALVNRFRDLLPLIHSGLTNGSADVRFAVAPMTGNFASTDASGWLHSLGDVARAFDAATNCVDCVDGVSFSSVRTIADTFIGPVAAQSVRPGAVVRMILVTDRAPVELAGGLSPAGLLQLHNTADFIGSRMALEHFGGAEACSASIGQWGELAMMTGGTQAGLCHENEEEAVDDLVTRLVASSTGIEIPTGAVPSSLRFYIDGHPFGFNHEDGFVADATSGSVALFGMARDALEPAPGERRPVISVSYDSVR